VFASAPCYSIDPDCKSYRHQRHYQPDTLTGSCCRHV